eukprot:CAMPEP_0184310064 /NCGR_PEP_ID=MMETSP1049-20130417/23029_1 /TAXON_ID=77928 /ORGANISM="Proteomonas sulcata, Strain CCMP704" /LENGTH=116 /DNA_ID=CAMNT_0026623535 /DNA_START=33 /DNA_END=383 /DNA_ORIENTATION=+
MSKIAQVVLLVVALLPLAAGFASAPLAGLRQTKSLRSPASCVTQTRMVASLPPKDDEDLFGKPIQLPKLKDIPPISWFQDMTPAKKLVFGIVAMKESVIIAVNWQWIVSHIQGTAP